MSSVCVCVCVCVCVYQDTYAHIQPEAEEATTTNNAARKTTETPLKTWWEGPLPDRFLPGQSSDTLYQNLSEAQAACLKLAVTGQEFSKVLVLSLSLTHARTRTHTHTRMYTHTYLKLAAHVLACQ